MYPAGTRHKNKNESLSTKLANRLRRDRNMEMREKWQGPVDPGLL